MGLKPICFPNTIKDMVIITLFPPLWVFLKELRAEKPMENFVRIFINLILTSLFYFPGLMHALQILRFEGPI